MAIKTEDIKIKASQRLTDNPNGGGFMTSHEIVDGQINNMFPNISRINEATGCVHLREGFFVIDNDVSVALENAPDNFVPDTAAGCHLIISKKAENPNVNVCLFDLGGSGSQRSDAQDRLESYLTAGPRLMAWCWGNQPQGSRQILTYMPVTATPPRNGSVIIIYNNHGLPNETRQYVRITAVDATSQQFNGQTQAENFNRQVVILSISDPLQETFAGREMSRDDSVPTNLYTTTVTDAAKYYGAMTPATDYAAGDISIRVESIFHQLVPTSQQETPLLNLAPGDVAPMAASGTTTTITITLPSGSLATAIGAGCMPGSVSVTIANITYRDNGGGLMLLGAAQSGTIDYGTGIITWAAAKSGNAVITYDPGVGMMIMPRTMMIPVPEIDRGFNYVAIIWPPPVRGTITADYMAQTNWYRLIDQGNGQLSGLIDGTGTGSIPDYLSGQLSITTAAIPDAEAPIMLRWGVPIEIINLPKAGSVQLDPISFKLGKPVWPGGVSITWPTSNQGTAQIHDDGIGNFIGDGAGWINYSTGDGQFAPTIIPQSGGQYNILAQQVNPDVLHVMAPATLAFELPTEATPGSVAVSITVTIAGQNYTYKLVDKGNGQLVASGETLTLESSRSCLSDSSNYSQSGAGATNQKDSNFGGGSSSTNNPGQNSSGSGSESISDTQERIVTLTVGPVTAIVSYGNTNNHGTVIIDISQASAQKKTITTREKKNDKSGNTSTSNSQTATGFFGQTTTTTTNSSGQVSHGVSSESSTDIQNFPAPSSPSNMTVMYMGPGAKPEPAAQSVMDVPPLVIRLTPDNRGVPLIPGSIDFSLNGTRYRDTRGVIMRSPDPITGIGAICGSVDYAGGTIQLDEYPAGPGNIEVRSLAGRLGSQFIESIGFRTPGEPVRQGSFVMEAISREGTRLSAVAGFGGNIDAPGIHGGIDYLRGIVVLSFGDWVKDDPSIYQEVWYNAALKNPQNEKEVWKPMSVYADSISYACVIYSYIALDAARIGLNPVRLPTDGRVPVVKSGDIVVIHHTDTLTLSSFPAQGAIVALPRQVDSLEIYDATQPPQRLPKTMYTFKPGDNFLTIAGAADFSSYAVPLTVAHKIEDRKLVSDTQINGVIKMAAPLLNNYPQAGTLVSTALVFGDLQSRYENIFNQQNWGNSWLDSLSGGAATGKYNDIDYPIRVKNSGCITERWAIVFQDAATVRVIGEKRGQVAQNLPITQDVKPINSATGQPYFFMDFRGFGGGWATNNVIRFNTIGAAPPFWVAETILPGPSSQLDYDQFIVMPRSDVE